MTELKDARQALVEAYSWSVARADETQEYNILRDVRMRTPFQELLRTFEQEDGPADWVEIRDLGAYFVAEYGLRAGLPQGICAQMTARLQQVIDLAAKEHPIWVTPPPAS